MLLEEYDEQSLIEPEIDDIDIGDYGDPAFVSEYVDDIFRNLLHREKKDTLPVDYLDIQPELKPRHRDILVEWMCEVNLSLKMTSETLLSSVHLVDQVLSTRGVSRKKVQLLGAGAILIAAKFEELRGPRVKDLEYICCNAYTHEEFVEVERLILDQVGWDLAWASPLYFLRRWSKAAMSDSQTHTLSKYLLELSVTSSTLSSFRPSVLAASAVWLARRMVDSTAHCPWNANLKHYSGFHENDLFNCVMALNQCLRNHQNRAELSTIYIKYSSPKLYSVARIPPVESL
jgi:hypothetical protein